MNTTELQTLTVKEALKQGYKHCGRPDQDWGHLTNIEDLRPIDFEEEEFVLADKKGFHSQVSEENIKEHVADLVHDQHTNECNDDTDEVYNMVMKEIDFKPLVDQINEKLSQKKWYRMTDIKLIQ